MTYIGIDVSKATFVVYRHGVLRMQPKGRKQVGCDLLPAFCLYGLRKRECIFLVVKEGAYTSTTILSFDSHEFGKMAFASCRNTFSSS